MKDRVALLVATCVLLALLAVPAVFVRKVRFPQRGIVVCFRWLPVKVVHVAPSGRGLSIYSRVNDTTYLDIVDSDHWLRVREDDE